jgi:4-hydroxybenzoate polyprenyltransferase
MSTSAGRRDPLATRLWTYQRERFPLAAYVPLIGISALAVGTWSAGARGRPALPSAPLLAVGMGTALVFFFLLRVADEHKDAGVDRLYRPELPVPRGLVSLAELRRVGAMLALLAVAANAFLAPRLLLALLPAAAWAGLMAREFFAAEWLRARPMAYLLSHMGVMPLLFAYLTGLDWLATGLPAPRGLPFFLALAFLNGLLVEIGRKIRAPETERPGVETYTVVWGRRAAPAAWLAALAAAVLAGWAASAESAAGLAGIALAVLAAATALPALAFLRRATPSSAKGIEAASGLWTLASYLVLAFTPFLRVG